MGVLNSNYRIHSREMMETMMIFLKKIKRKKKRENHFTGFAPVISVIILF